MQAINGIVPDGKALVYKAREEAVQYEKMYGIKMPGKVIAERVAQTTHLSTIYMGKRPYGTSAIVASHDKISGFTLWMVEPSGQCYQYFGCASGRGKQLARNEIEKGGFKEMTCQEAVPKVMKILLKAQDEIKDQKMEVEISMISEATNFRHVVLSRADLDPLQKKTEEEIESEDVDMS